MIRWLAAVAVAVGAALGAPPQIRDTFEHSAKLVRYEDEMILVGYPIQNPNAELFKLLRAPMVTDEKRIAPNTIYQNRYYQLLRIAPGGPSEAMLERRMGTEVRLVIVRFADGSLAVKDIR